MCTKLYFFKKWWRRRRWRRRRRQPWWAARGSKAAGSACYAAPVGAAARGRPRSPGTNIGSVRPVGSAAAGGGRRRGSGGRRGRLPRGGTHGGPPSRPLVRWPLSRQLGADGRRCWRAGGRAAAPAAGGDCAEAGGAISRASLIEAQLALRTALRSCKMTSAT